ncbi:MAG: dienelactone hydrolase family protein [Nitrospira sp.]
MANIRETMVEYPGEGMALTDYVAAPATKEARPAIIIVQEWWGLDGHIKDIAKRFADEGYVAIALDLYFAT